MPGNVLVLAQTASGRPWAVPLPQADPLLLVAGRPMPADPASTTCFTEGSLHLTAAHERERLDTGLIHCTARAALLVWGDPQTLQVRNHVPSFLAVETDGVALVDVAGRGGPSAAAPYGTVSWLAAERGWGYELLDGADQRLDRAAILREVLDAPGDLVSVRLRAACEAAAPTAALVGSITTPGDLLVLLPLLRCMTPSRVRAPRRDSSPYSA